MATLLPSSPVEMGLFTALLVVLGGVSHANRRQSAARRATEAAHEICGIGILVARPCGRILEANDSARRLLWPKQMAKGPLALPEPIRLLLSEPGPQHHTLRVRDQKLIDLSISPCIGKIGGPRGVVVQDVTEERRGQHHLLQLAHYDSLTGLGNRRLFIDRLEAAIGKATDSGGQLGLLYIDIDRFKEVNDSHGHGAGDELLKTMATRFRQEMDSLTASGRITEASVARLSGDEFAIIVMDISSTSEIEEVAQSVLQRIGAPMQIEDRWISCSGSMGISLFPEHGADVEDLVKAADAALYVAKERGRAHHVVYENAFRSEAEQSRKIEQQLRGAIERGELELHYQPKVELQTDTVAGFEALLRWTNPELGFVSPKDFIPLAEERGLICELGAWCIDEACRQIRIWQDAGFDPVPVSVNVSSAQFRDDDLQRVISDALVRHNIQPSVFEIELTESLILDDSDTTALTLRDLKAIGVHIALDDFGTGYSALTYLNRFPLDTVKMDRGFLRGIEDDDSIAGIASAVITMSHSLGFEVVAEGVDSERQSQLLRSMGCDQIQGFLYSPAIPALEATRFLAHSGSNRPPVRSRTKAPEIDQILSTLAPVEPDSPLSEIGRSSRGSKKRASTPPETRVLVIDESGMDFGRVALRMLRLGADVHLVQGIDEAILFVRQEEPLIDLLIVPPDIDLPRFANLFETIQKLAPDRTPRVLVLGDEPHPSRRLALREAKVDWVLWGAAQDSELRFFIGTARFQASGSHSRRSVRVPVEITAWIRAGGQRLVGVVTSLSRRGAFIETSDAYEINKPIRLEFKTEDSWIRIFANVSYQEVYDDSDAASSPSGIGVIFYEVDRETEDELSVIIEQVWSRHLP